MKDLLIFMTALLLIGYGSLVATLSMNFERAARSSSCVSVTADISKADIDGYIHQLDGSGEWSVLAEPDGEYTVFSKPRECREMK